MQNVSSMNEFSSLDTNDVHFHLCSTNLYVTSIPVKQHVLHFEVQPYLAVTVSRREIVLIFFFLPTLFKSCDGNANTTVCRVTCHEKEGAWFSLELNQTRYVT